MLLSHRRLLIAITVLALVATACGSDGGATTTAADTGTTGTTAADTGTTAAEATTTAAATETTAAAGGDGNVVFWTGSQTLSIWRRCRRSSTSSMPWAAPPPSWSRSQETRPRPRS